MAKSSFIFWKGNLKDSMPMLKPPTKREDKQAIELHLSKLLSICEPINENQIQPVNGIWTELDAHRLAITQRMGPLPKSISEGQRLKFLGGGIARLAHLPEEQQTLDRLYIEMNSMIETGRPVTVTILAFLNIARQSAPSEFQIGSTKITRADPLCYKRFTTNNALAAKLGDIARSDIKILESRLSQLTGYEYTIELPRPKYASGLFHVHAELVEPLERLRSLMNFANLVGQRNSVTSPLPVAHSTFTSSPLWFFEVDGNVLGEILYVHSSYESPNRGRMRWEGWSELPSFSKLVTDIGDDTDSENTIKSLVWNLLRLYQEGMDSTDRAIAFLHFWQIIERSTCPRGKDQSLGTDRIISRLESLLSFPKLEIYHISKAEKDALKSLGNLRHTFAHRGEFPRPLGEFYFQILKRYADFSIIWLLRILPYMNDTTLLEAYYVVCARSHNINIDMLKTILEFFEDE